MPVTKKISKHISYKEGVVSATATRRNIKNEQLSSSYIS